MKPAGLKICRGAGAGALAGVVWLLAFPAFAQLPLRDTEAESEFVLRNWDVRDGLPAGRVTCIQRTADGYLWVGTPAGLARFDGLRFRTFQTDNPPAPGTNAVHCLLTDRAGDLWIGTAAGLLRLKRGDFDAGNSTWLWSNTPISALLEDAAGAVWAASPGQDLLRTRGQSTERIEFPLTLKEEDRLLLDASNRVCVFSGGAIWVRQEESWTRELAPPPGFPEFEAVSAHREGGFWVAISRGLLHLTNAASLPEPRRLPDEIEAPRARVNEMIEDRTGRVWAATFGGGIFCFDSQTGWQRVTPRRSRPPGAVMALYEDPEGIIWAGTANRGLYQLKPRQATAWSLPIAAHEGIPHTVCVAHDGSVWVGTDGAGVFRFGNGVTTRYGRAQGLEQLSVAAILEDRRTNLWVGTPRGLYRFERGFMHAVTNDVVGRRAVSALFEDREGTLWIGLAGVLVRMHGGQFRAFELPTRYRPFEIRAIAQNNAGTIYIGTRGGGVFRLTKGQLVRLNGIQRTAVISLYIDAEHALWLGTLNRGLSRVKGEDITHWTTEDGLPDNTIYAMLEDDAHTLWMSSNEGVFGFSREVLTNYAQKKGPPLLAHHLAFENGVADLACLGSGQPSATRSSDGRFWFPTTRGVVSFDPARLPREHAPLTVILEEVWVDGVVHSAAGLTSLRVPSAARRIEFRYTSPDMISPERLRFRHRLEGLESDWVDAGTQRIAHYGQLAPGHYEFRVMAGVQDVWQPAAQSFRLDVVPRLWERTGFQLALILGGLVVVGLTVRTVERSRARRRLARLETQHAMERERTRIAKDLHDDLGTGITEIMLLGELAGREDTPAHEQRGHIHAITEKSRQLAVAMDETVWTVNPKNDSLPNLASYLADFAREFFSASPVRCRVALADNLPPVTLSASQRHNLFLAAKEALNNVARHSGAGEVWLRLRHERGLLEIVIEDNGRGFGPAHPAIRGNGLSNIGARLEALGGRAEIESHPGRGTTVRLVVPISDPATSPG